MARRILIVDDEAYIRDALRLWMIECGFEVDTAADGQAAVEKCLQTDYDIIAMDLEMPRMNGLDAIVAIRQSRPDIPILVLTGLPRDYEEVLALGATKVLSKPVRLRDLETEVRQALAPV